MYVVGAGKTTLLNAIAGRTELTSGLVTLNSVPLNKGMRRKISYVLQSDTFLTQLTFWDTIWVSGWYKYNKAHPMDNQSELLLLI